MTACSVSYCNKASRTKGLCDSHYMRKLNGRADWDQKSMYEKTVQERFWEKVDKAGPIPDYAPHLGNCWVWTGTVSTSRNGDKYGKFHCLELHPDSVGAHRVSYFWETGIKSDPENHLDHLCRNTLCVRPSHLEWVTAEENVKRGMGPTAVNARKTHCIHGHELSGENVYAESGKYRKCRMCHKKVSREWARRNRQNAKNN